MPELTISQLGVFVVGVFTILGGVLVILSIATQIRGLTTGAESDRPVRRGDLDHAVERLTSRVDCVATQHTELAEYTHQAVHELRDSLHTISAKVDAATMRVEKEVALMRAILESRFPPRPALPIHEPAQEAQ